MISHSMPPRNTTLDAPLIFLDFDGVIAPFDGDGTLDAVCVARLETLVARTGAAVVISSAWRHRYTLDELRAFLSKCGFTGEVIGVTPTLLTETRAGEIAAYVSASGGCEVFVVLDDAPPDEALCPRWIVTDESIGLQDDDIDRAVRLLCG